MTLLKKVAGELLKKHNVIWILVGLITVGLYLCLTVPNNAGRGEPEDDCWLRVIDSYHRVITIAQEPSRVVSLAPGITEIIFALGKGKTLVGRTDYCDYPEEAGGIESVGNIMNPSIEKIVELNPDIVIASTHFQKTVLKKLEDLGVKVAVLYGEENFDGVYDTIRQVGKILNSNEKAAQVITAMQKKVTYITSAVEHGRKPKVFYIVFYGDGGFYTAGQGTFIGNMLTLAGGDNAAADSKGWQYSIEKLVEKDPEFLICSKFYHTKSVLERTPGLKDVQAVKEGRLLEIDHNLLDRQGPRLAEGLETLARLLHPEIFGDCRKE